MNNFNGNRWRRQWQPTPALLPGKPHGRRSLDGCSSGVARSRTRLSDFTFTFHFHALEKEMATHSSVLAWRIPGTVEPGGLPSMGSHRVGHNWSDLAAAAAATVTAIGLCRLCILSRLNLAAYKDFEEFVHYFLVVEFINIRFVFPYYAFNRCRICSDILFHSWYWFLPTFFFWSVLLEF